MEEDRLNNLTIYDGIYTDSNRIDFSHEKRSKTIEINAFFGDYSTEFILDKENAKEVVNYLNKFLKL